MITRTNYRFLALGLAIGFALATCLFAPQQPTPHATGPQMKIVMNTRNLTPPPANPIIIPAAPSKELFPVRLEVLPRNGTPEINRAIKRAQEQKHHLIYREIPPFE